MSRDEDTERIVIICDKRGAELTQYLEDGMNARRKTFIVEADIWCQPGANIAKTGVRSGKESKKITEKYDYAYLFGGIYDIVSVHEVLATGKFDNTGDLVETLYTRYENARHRLQKIAHRPVVCQLIGTDIYMFNKQAGDMQVESQNATNWVYLM